MVTNIPAVGQRAVNARFRFDTGCRTHFASARELIVRRASARTRAGAHWQS
jgi:hypothetical protein